MHEKPGTLGIFSHVRLVIDTLGKNNRFAGLIVDLSNAGCYRLLRRGLLLFLLSLELLQL